MLVNCNSCQKKFVVPDSAITKTGRLVQCGSCGSKWTQYPAENISVSKVTPQREKSSVKKNKPKKNLYTPEYLQKKHGLSIEKPKNLQDKKLTNIKQNKNSFGFYSYITMLFVFFTTIFGVLNLMREAVVLKYPFLESYINYLYEVIYIIKITLFQLIN